MGVVVLTAFVLENLEEKENSISAITGTSTVNDENFMCS